MFNCFKYCIKSSLSTSDAENAKEFIYNQEEMEITLSRALESSKCNINKASLMTVNESERKEINNKEETLNKSERTEINEKKKCMEPIPLRKSQVQKFGVLQELDIQLNNTRFSTIIVLSYALKL